MWYFIFVFFARCEELEKIISSFIQEYDQSKDAFVKHVRDDVVFLAPDEPIINGRKGEI